MCSKARRSAIRIEVRVNAQLIDAESGAHLWAERFEEDLTDLFKLQDQVVARLANTLGFELVKAEAEKSTRSRSPDVVDLDMRGWVMLQQWLGTTKDYVSAARAWFEQALKIDPNDPDALAGVGLHPFSGFCARMAKSRDRLRGKGARSGRPGHSARSRQSVGVLRESELPRSHETRERGCRLRRRRTRHRSKFCPALRGAGDSLKIFSAATNKRYPMCSMRCV